MPYDPDTGEWIEPPATTPPPGQQQRTDAEWADLRRAQRDKERAERELAFFKAGIDSSKDSKLGFFVKGYDGKIDPEEIRKAALEAGFLEETPPPGPAQTPPPAGAPALDDAAIAAQRAAELAAQQAVAAGATGATPPPTDASTLIEDAFRKGGEGAMLDVFASMGVPIAREGIIQE